MTIQRAGGQAETKEEEEGGQPMCASSTLPEQVCLLLPPSLWTSTLASSAFPRRLIPATLQGASRPSALDWGCITVPSHSEASSFSDRVATQFSALCMQAANAGLRSLQLLSLSNKSPFIIISLHIILIYFLFALFL